MKATPGGVAGVYSATFPRSEVRPRDSLHFISIVFWLSVAEGPIEHERDGTTDLAAWIALEELGVLPLGAVAKYGLTLLSGRSARS